MIGKNIKSPGEKMLSKRIKIETDEMKLKKVVEERFKNQPSKKYTQNKNGIN